MAREAGHLKQRTVQHDGAQRLALTFKRVVEHGLDPFDAGRLERVSARFVRLNGTEKTYTNQLDNNVYKALERLFRTRAGGPISIRLSQFVDARSR
ncbi:hypothetical protein [Trinickia mobilis]|uniref:hypothetical protein n=1 Tax=Trinickia mobilis TaxID=2816356 RepID=UPI001A8F4773|nr:hypothetical protein [Trinickia mobilis]